MGGFVWTFQGGKKVVNVTSVTVVNNTLKSVLKTVPVGKRWMLLSIKVVNPDDVNRSITVRHWLEVAATNLIKILVYNAAIGTGAALQYPINIEGTYIYKFIPSLEILDAGETLGAVWGAGGASAGGTTADGLVIEYMEMDME